MKKVTLSTILLLIIALTGCKQKVSQKAAMEGNNTPSFTLPQIPELLTDPESRAAFLSLHYWDHFPFTDTTYLSLPDITEQALVNFLDILSHVPTEQVEKSLQSLFQKASVEPQMSQYFWENIKRYWDDPNSPLRNETNYLLACKSAIALKEKIATPISIQAAYDLKQLSKNQVGTLAANFSFTMANQQVKKLLDLKECYTVLFFYNPACETCEESKLFMVHSEVFNEALDKEQLQIVAIYPDEEYEEWHKNLSTMPKRWIIGCDPEQQINKQQLYYLQAIPTCYLLDKNKEVLLKDASIQEIELYLKNKSL